MRNIVCLIFGHKQEKPKPKFKGWLAYSDKCVRCKKPLYEEIKLNCKCGISSAIPILGHWKCRDCGKFKIDVKKLCFKHPF